MIATYQYPVKSKVKEKHNPKGVVLYLHGLNSHSQRYCHMGRILSNNSYDCVAFDQQGYGESEGYQGYIVSKDIWVDLAVEFINRLSVYYQKNYNIQLGKQTPLFILGQSLGGMAAARIPYQKKLKIPINGAILFAPAIREHRKIGKLPSCITTMGIGLGRCLNFLYICRKLPLTKSPLSDSSKNKELEKDFAKDKLRFSGRVKPGSLINVLDSIEEARESAGKFNTPVLIVQGGKDKKVNPIGAFEFYERVKSKDKTMMFYEDLWHDVLHEPEIFGILKRVIEWCNERLTIEIQINSQQNENIQKTL